MRKNRSNRHLIFMHSLTALLLSSAGMVSSAQSQIFELYADGVAVSLTGAPIAVVNDGNDDGAAIQWLFGLIDHLTPVPMEVEIRFASGVIDIIPADMFPSGDVPGNLLTFTPSGIKVSGSTVLGEAFPGKVSFVGSSSGDTDFVVHPVLIAGHQNGQNMGLFKAARVNEVEFRDFSIDYRDDRGNPTTFTQGEIIAIGTVGSALTSYTVLIDPGYKDPDVDSIRMMTYDATRNVFRGGAASREIETVIVDPWNSLDPVGTRRGHVTHKPIAPHNDSLVLGDVVAVLDFPKDSGPALWCIKSNDLYVYNVTIMSSPQMGLAITDVSDVNVLEAHIVPGDAPMQISNTAQVRDRIVSTNRDGIHVFDSRGEVMISQCDFERVGDDGVAVHNYYYVGGYVPYSDPGSPGQSLGEVVLTLKTKNASVPEIGDMLRFYDKVTNLYLDKQILSLSGLGPLPGSLLPRYKVLFDFPVQHSDLSEVVVDNLTASIPVAKVLNNDFSLIYARGVISRTSNCLIQGNTMEHTLFAGVAVTADLDYSESGCAQGVRIIGNQITHASSGEFRPNHLRGAISVYNRSAYTGGVEVQGWNSEDLYRNVLISGNAVASCSGPPVLVSNTTNLEVSSNHFYDVNGKVPAAQLSGAARAIALDSVVHLELVDGANFVNNHIYGTNPFGGSTPALGPVIVEVLNSTNVIATVNGPGQSYTFTNADTGFTVH